MGLGRGKVFAVPLLWAWNVASQPEIAAPAPLRDNANGILVTHTITYTYDPLNRLTTPPGRATPISTTLSAIPYRCASGTFRLTHDGVFTYTYPPVTWTSQRRRALVPGVAEGDGARGELIIVLFYPL